MKVQLYIVEYRVIDEEDNVTFQRAKSFPTQREMNTFAKEMNEGGFFTQKYPTKVSNTKRGFIAMFNHFQSRAIGD